MKAQKPSGQKSVQALSVILFCLATPTTLHASGDPVVYGMTQGRLTSIFLGFVDIASVITGALALRSSTKSGFKKGAATWSVVLGSFSMLLSLVHLSNATGGFGTGSGKAGAIVAIVFGLTGTTLGGLALWRARSSKKGARVRSFNENYQEATNTGS